MTLYNIIQIIKDIASKQPTVGSVNEGDVYAINSSPSVKYANITITQTTHSQDEMFDNYSFHIFYTDRLVDDMEKNRLQIQSIGKEVLSNIVTILEEKYNIEHQNISFQPFTQRFTDECAGMYITITLVAQRDIICGELY